MADEYWIVIETRRWKFFKKRNFFRKVCEYNDVRTFMDDLVKEYPNDYIRLGITRGKDIYLL